MPSPRSASLARPIPTGEEAAPGPVPRGHWLPRLCVELISLALTVFRIPARSAEASLGGQQIRLTAGTVPDPPKTGPIPLQIRIADSSGNPIAVEEVRVSYGMASDAGTQTVALLTASAGLYRAGRFRQGWRPVDRTGSSPWGCADDAAIPCVRPNI